MIKKEWQALFKNKFLLLVMLTLMLIPSLYNLIFLSSMWDPYGNIDHLPVAVVNKDKGTQLNGQAMTLGKDLSSDMEKSATMDYHFVGADKASKGLKSGKYYMVVTFPKNLSTNAASLMDTAPKKVKIDYQTSKGHNFISSKMSESAMQQLQQSVTQNITQEYTTTLFKNLSQLKSGVSQMSAGSSEIANGENEAANGSDQISSNLTKLSNSTLTFSDGASQLKIGLQQYTAGMNTVVSGAQQLSVGSVQFSSATQQLEKGLTQLSQQTELSNDEKTQLTQLQSGLSQLNNAIQSGSSSSSVLETELTAMSTAAETILQSEKVQSDAIKATDAYQSLTSDQQAEILNALQSSTSLQAAQQVLQSVQNLQTELTSMGAQQQQLQSTANQVLPMANSSILTLVNGLTSTNSALKNQILPGATALTKNSISLQQGVAHLSNGVQQLQNNGPQLTNGSNILAQGAQQVHTGSSQLSAGSLQLNGSLKQLSVGANQLASSLGEANKQLNSTHTNSKNAKALASPLKIKQTDHDNVSTNGVGMAPYMISVALFVGALSTNLIVGRGFAQDKRSKSRIDFLLGKLATNGVIAICQGILVSFAVALLGLQANNFLGLLFGNILISFTFMMIVTFLNLWLGKVGAFISLILLLVQLATSAGTYPIQLEWPIYQALSPWFPMTYAVLYLRQVISLTSSVGSYVIILVIMAVVFMVLIPVTLSKRHFQDV